MADDVVELATDSQSFLDRAAAGLLLATLGFAGELRAHGHDQCPVVADRGARSASGGGYPDGAGIGPSRLARAKRKPGRQQRGERRPYRAAQAPPPPAQVRHGVAGDQRAEHDQTTGILGGRPGQGDRVDDDQHHYWVAPAQRQGAGHDPEQPARHGVEWARVGDPLGSGAG
jgi:hypothetical protein